MTYNKFNNPALKALKTIKKQIKHKCNPDGFTDFHNFLGYMLTMAALSKDSVAMASAEILFLYEENHLVHYFLETADLEDFLKNTKVNDIMAIRQMVLLDNSANNRFFRFESNGGIDGARSLGGVIHSPTQHDAVAFVCIRNEKDTSFSISAETGDDVVYSGNLLLDDALKSVNSKADDKNQLLPLVVNMLLYIQAFPESVIDKAPEGQATEYYRNKCHTIRTSSTILEHGGKTPHFRRGHFRLLSSERFINKRGQIVFVHSSFVGGKAKTILDDNVGEDLL